jgi:hypothetical protein
LDALTLRGEPPAKEPTLIQPISVSGIAYAKIIDGMMNVGLFHDRAAADGRNERVIVAKLVFPGTASMVKRTVIVGQAMLEAALLEQAELQGGGGLLMHKSDDSNAPSSGEAK